MKEIIFEKLKAIEHQFDIRILYACESGSRAWGLHLLIAIMMCVLSTCTGISGEGRRAIQLVDDLFRKSDLPDQPNGNLAELKLMEIRESMY